ncbi:MAG: NAD(P)H-hydrate dehydratase [Clostridiales bacterium]|nr:NAD(P)H-hydrate dehydratase [Clostridiales bacterium]
MGYPESIIKKRPEDSHKGMFGTVKLLCGSEQYTGAAMLSVSGALRSGCGMVKLFTAETAALPVRTRYPEAIICPTEEFSRESGDSAVIGCGIGRGLDGILEGIFSMLSVPAVIDADGINFIASNIDILGEIKTPFVLTPHPKEFARITGSCIGSTLEERKNAAAEFASEHGCVMLLKGHETVVASPEGRVYINTTGCSALAKGGSGDVLAGVIGSLLAQGYAPFDAASLGAYIHGAAGEAAAERYGLHGALPQFLPEEIGRLLG